MDEFFKPIRTVLPDGLRVITMRTPAKGIVAGLISIGWGAMHAAAIDEKWRGMPHFMEHVVGTSATQGYKREQINKEMTEKLHVSPNASTNNFTTVYLSSGKGNGLCFLKEHFWTGFELTARSVFYPMLDRWNLGHQRKRVLNEIVGNSGGANKATEEFHRALYGAEWVTRPVGGNPKDIKTYTLKDLSYFHAAYYTRQNTSVVIAGDIDHAEAVERMDTILCDAQPRGERPPALFPPAVQRGELKCPLPGAPKDSMFLGLYFSAANYSDPKGNAYTLVSNGLKIILSDNVSKKFGLYSAYASHQWGLEPSSRLGIFIELGTPSQASDVVKQTMKVLSSKRTEKEICSMMEWLKETNKALSLCNQRPLEELTNELVCHDKIGSPLYSKDEKVAAYSALTREDVLGVLREINNGPAFLYVASHPGCIDKAPSIDEIDAWRGWTGPSAPEKHRKNRHKPGLRGSASRDKGWRGAKPTPLP